MYKYLKSIKRVDFDCIKQSSIKFTKNRNLNTSLKKYYTFNSLKKNCFIIKYYFLIINKLKKKKFFLLSFVFFESFYKKFQKDFIKDKKFISKKINNSISVLLNFLLLFSFDIFFTFLLNLKGKIICLKSKIFSFGIYCNERKNKNKIIINYLVFFSIQKFNQTEKSNKNLYILEYSTRNFIEFIFINFFSNIFLSLRSSAKPKTSSSSSLCTNARIHKVAKNKNNIYFKDHYNFFIKNVKNYKVNKNKNNCFKFFCLKKKEFFYFMFFKHIYYYINLLFNFHYFSFKKIQYIIIMKIFSIKHFSKKNTLLATLFCHVNFSKTNKRNTKFLNKFSQNNNMFFLFNTKNCFNNIIFELYNRVLFLNNYFSIFINQKYKTLKCSKFNQNIYNFTLLLKFQKIFYCIEMTYFLSKKKFYNKKKVFLFFKIQKLLWNLFIFKKKAFLTLYSIIFSKKKYTDFYSHLNHNSLKKKSIYSIFIKKILSSFEPKIQNKQEQRCKSNFYNKIYKKKFKSIKKKENIFLNIKKIQMSSTLFYDTYLPPSFILLTSFLQRNAFFLLQNENKAKNLLLNNVEKNSRKIEIILGPLKFGFSFELHYNIFSYYTFNYFIKQAIKTIKSNFLFYDCLNFYKKKFLNSNNYDFSSFSEFLQSENSFLLYSEIKESSELQIQKKQSSIPNLLYQSKINESKKEKKVKNSKILKKILIKKNRIYELLLKKKNLVINNQNFFYVLKQLIEILKQIRPFKFILHLKRFLFFNKNLKKFIFFNIILKSFYPYSQTSNFVLNSFEIENYLKLKMFFLIKKFTKINMSFLKKNSIRFFLSKLNIQNNFLAILFYILLLQIHFFPYFQSQSEKVSLLFHKSNTIKDSFLPLFTSFGITDLTSLAKQSSKSSINQSTIDEDKKLKDCSQSLIIRNQRLQMKERKKKTSKILRNLRLLKKSKQMKVNEHTEKNTNIEYIKLYKIGFYYGSFLLNFNINFFDIIDILYKKFYISFLRIQKLKVFKMKSKKYHIPNITKKKYSFKTYIINLFKYKFMKSVLEKFYLNKFIKKKNIKSILSLCNKYQKSLKNKTLFLYDFKKFFFNYSFLTIYKNFQIIKIQNKNKLFLIKKWDPLKKKIYQKILNYIWKKNKKSFFYEKNYSNIFSNSKFSNCLITDKNNIFVLNSKYTIINKYADATISWNTKFNINYIPNQKEINNFCLKKRKILSLEKMSSLKKNGLNFKGFFLFFTCISNKVLDSKKKSINTKDSLIIDSLIKKEILILKNHKMQHFHSQYVNFKINTGLIPSKKFLKKHLNLLKNIIVKYNSQIQKKLLYKLSFSIINWSYYYKIVTNSQLFYYCDNLINKLIWKWACYNHPNKSKKWIQQKYFFSLKNKKWVFGILPHNFDSKSSTKDIFYLPFHNFFINF